jgi:hypothetical protein
MTIETKFNIGDTVYYANGPHFRKGVVEIIIARVHTSDRFTHTDYVVSGHDIGEKEMHCSMDSLYEQKQAELKAVLDKSLELIASDDPMNFHAVDIFPNPLRGRSLPGSEYEG